MTIDLFSPCVPQASQHILYQRLMHPEYAAEKAELERWAEGFVDRDGKFVDEFQRTFESSFWELYIFEILKHLEYAADFSVASPDFVVECADDFLIEAAIARPAQGEPGPIGYSLEEIPDAFDKFNRDATIRLCNSFAGKVKRYREYYSSLPHCANKPFVIAIGAFDRPGSHFSADRSIMAAMYGVYTDEDETLRSGSRRIVRYSVTAAVKSPTATVPVGLFCDDTYSEVSAVVYSALATWGKLRALADNPSAMTTYTTLHPNPDGLQPIVKSAAKKDYSESVFDGLYVLHNPFAKHPLGEGVLSHRRIAEVKAVDGQITMYAPEDMLLTRMLMSTTHVDPRG